ncbi:hypothetical protein C5O32_06890 [Campylobacter jejuni]|nr:hypothetical protein [Campylobacter jejuni]EAJ4309468.1 hypothetical protein [Campylobacter jejuni]EAM0367480.1 hypothetical protein [Campylobacter jejuni]ECK2561377.1 hypothetical protein [Campylobacter jejuni]ECR0771448.1 hypothetical protein [Campylobacter jejuni]
MKSFTLNGLESLLKKCENLEDDKKQIILREIFAEKLLKESKENLEKEQDSFGKKWAPLKQSTLKSRKAQKIMHTKKLFATGSMQSSLHSGVENDKAYVALNATYKGFAYASVHQFGSKKVEARAFLPIDNKLNINTRVAKEMEEEVKDMLWTLFKQSLK